MSTDRRAILFGVGVSAVLSATMVVAGLKAGITPGVSPLVILCAWGAFAAASRGAGGRRFLNLAQVAGSAGMAIVAGGIFTAPLLQHLHLARAEEALRAAAYAGDLRALPWSEASEVLAAHGLSVPTVDVWVLIVMSLAGALMGYGFVGLATRKFLTDPTLPAPEARACETMIRTATADAARRPAIKTSLVLGLVASFVSPLLVHLSLAREHIVLFSKKLADRSFQLDLPFAPIYIGIGGLLTLATALLVFAGSSLRLVGDWALASIAGGSDLAALYPANSMRWVGGGAMTVAVAYSLVKFMGPRSSSTGAAAADALLEIEPRVRRGLGICIALGVAILIAWLVSTDGATPFAFAMTIAILVMAMLMVTLGAILSLQIGSSASPVSGTIFVTTLVLCLVALAVGRASVDDVPILTALLVGACVAVCTANDSSQDYKTLQLCGVAPRDGFRAQLAGLLAGCVVVPLAIFVAHEAYGLGSNQLTAPQGEMFATLVDGLLIQESLPWHPILLGLLVGAVAVGMDVLATRRGLQLPAMALAVGIYLPGYLGVGILIGALFRAFGERARAAETGRRERTHESILAAAGLITGAAALELFLGIAILFRFDLDSLSLFSSTQEAGKFPIPAGVQVGVGLLGIGVLGGLLYHNARRGGAGETE
ncbi:MAG: hypothetical protein CMJ84_13305 [Planctomycetes bacterium]|nr:hypothetical protein [Planctomycetota bacterium]